jgi:hypothetical protein
MVSISYLLLESISDAELEEAVENRRMAARGPALGIRGIFRGDEYDYGSYSDWMIGEYSCLRQNRNSRRGQVAC